MSFWKNLFRKNKSHKNLREIEYSFDVFVDQLIKVVDEANQWAYNNGEYPRFKEYPQYQRIRELGIKINKVAGFKGMQKAIEIVGNSCIHPDRSCASYSVAEYSWKGIEGWLP